MYFLDFFLSSWEWVVSSVSCIFDTYTMLRLPYLLRCNASPSPRPAHMRLGCDLFPRVTYVMLMDRTYHIHQSQVCHGSIRRLLSTRDSHYQVEVIWKKFNRVRQCNKTNTSTDRFLHPKIFVYDIF